MNVQTAVIASIFLTSSALSLTAGAIGLGDGDKSATPALLGSSTGLILLGLILAVVFKSRNNRPRPDLDD